VGNLHRWDHHLCRRQELIEEDRLRVSSKFRPRWRASAAAWVCDSAGACLRFGRRVFAVFDRFRRCVGCEQNSSRLLKTKDLGLVMGCTVGEFVSL